MIETKNISKHYLNAEGVSFNALNEVNLQIRSNEFAAIVGKSGSGKSTLLNLLTGIDRPTQGEITVSGLAIQNLSEDQLALWRGENVGIVFQFFQLIPTLTVLENILLAMDFVGKIPKNKRLALAQERLAQVGILDQADKLPATLSGGQQQRAAIARALANDPAILIADEPTGNLDSQNAAAVLALFTLLLQEGKTLILVTHDEEIAQQAQRVIRIADGKIIAHEPAKK